MSRIVLIVLLLLAVVPAGAQEASVNRLEPLDWETAPFQHGIVTGRFYDEMAANPASFFDDWYDMSLDWIRIEFEEFMENPSLNYDDVDEQKEQYLTIIEAAHERGIRVLGLVNHNSFPGQLEWQGDPAVELTDESIDRYVESLRWHLETYPVDAVEIFNEPWGFGFGSGGEGPMRLAGYARLLIAAYEQVKPDFPDVTFMAPVTANAEAGTWLGHHGWQDSYYFEPEASIFNNSYMQAYRDENDDRLPLDVISWHPYGTGGLALDPNPAQKGPFADDFYFGRDFQTYYEQITNVVPVQWEGPDEEVFEVRYEDLAGRSITGDYPIVFTEYAWQSESEAGILGVRTMYEDMLEAMTLYPQIKGAFFYTYRDDPPVELRPDSQGNKFGLYAQNADGSYEPKLIYYSFVGHSSGVGLLEDGTVLDPIVKAYLEAGGRETLGLPTSEVTIPEENTYVQEFGDQTITYTESVVIE